MRAEKWFEKELKLIDKDYFVVWDDRIKRWVVMWRHPVVGSTSVMIVAKYDDTGQDIGYHPLDQRVLYALKRRKKISEKGFAELIREIDNANEELEQKFDAEEELRIRDCVRMGVNSQVRRWSK